jgi:hypothetical protein
MDLRRLGKHTVQVKEASAHVARETKHALTVRSAYLVCLDLLPGVHAIFS